MSLITLAPGIDAWTLAPAIRPNGEGVDLVLGIHRGEAQSALTLPMSRAEARRFFAAGLAATGDGTERTFEPSLLKRAAPEAVAAPVAQSASDRDAARAQGFTGDVCDACGAAKMLRTGHCLTCQNCSANTGCS